MIKGFLEALSSLGFHVLIFLAGLSLLYAAIFESLPSAKNSWQLITRNDPIGMLIWLGALAIAISLAMFAIGDKCDRLSKKAVFWLSPLIPEKIIVARAWARVRMRGAVSGF